MKKFTNILFTVILPLAAGIAIYIFARPTSVAGFNWIENTALKTSLASFQLDLSLKLPNIVLYNLPDFLWIFAFTSLMNLLWSEEKNSIKNLYVIAPLIIAFAHETGQGFSKINGTFDTLDLLFYIIGSGASIILYGYLKTYNEKETATSI